MTLNLYFFCISAITSLNIFDVVMILDYSLILSIFLFSSLVHQGIPPPIQVSRTTHVKCNLWKETRVHQVLFYEPIMN